MLGVISITVAILGFVGATSSSWYDLASAAYSRRRSARQRKVAATAPVVATTVAANESVPRVFVRPLTVITEPSMRYAHIVGW